ncbi:MAG TPA: DUF1499 domain-containing protein [Rhizomicrobium sp.]|jgi:hypothetical protein|nr:DUF1499 domain-containing protein [Rhizomicrobium sp.]
MRSQLFTARLALFLLALACLTALAAVGGVRASLMPFPSGFTIMIAATALGLLALVTALAWLFSALKHNHGAGKRMGLTALVGSLFLLSPPLHTEWRGLTSPAIHDATTDPEDPPQFAALAKLRRPGMNSPIYDGSEQITFRGETNTANYMLHTFYRESLTQPRGRLLTTKPKLFWHAFETVKKMGWPIVDYSEKDGRIEATGQSFWFGQTADIVIRVREAGPEGARLDARSQSETGTRDFGSNIARLEAFLKAL